MKKGISFVTELTREQIKLYEERCRPDHGHNKNSKIMNYGRDFYSDTGFISDQDSLFDICEEDDKTVMSLLGKGGHELIAKTLLCVMLCNNIETIKTYFPELYIDVDVNNYRIKHGSEYYGMQLCPFVDENTFECAHKCQIPNSSSVDITVTNKRINENRISPEKLIAFFDIKKPSK
jgi:hypothetical protein